MTALCVCGEPLATCPHLGVFSSLEAKVAFYATDLPELHAELAELETLAVRADAKRAVLIAQKAAAMAQQVAPEHIPGVLALITAALAKIATLLGG